MWDMTRAPKRTAPRKPSKEPSPPVWFSVTYNAPEPVTLIYDHGRSGTGSTYVRQHTSPSEEIRNFDPKTDTLAIVGAEKVVGYRQTDRVTVTLKSGAVLTLLLRG